MTASDITNTLASLQLAAAQLHLLLTQETDSEYKAMFRRMETEVMAIYNELDGETN